MPDSSNIYAINFLGIFNNTVAQPGVSYAWSFGDSTFSTLPMPYHVYADTGWYQVCLTAMDSAGCSATFCDMVGVGVSGPAVLRNISGSVLAGTNAPADYATVWLITFDPNSKNLYAVDSMQITPADSGQYLFPNVAISTTYTVKAALDSASADYANFVPTYYGGNLYWLTAQWFYTGVNGVAGIDISLAPGINTGGPGFIGGNVFAGANKTGTTALPNVVVMLMNGNGEAVAHTLSDANGDFSFSNLALGTYAVYVDMMNRTTHAATIALTSANASVATVMVEVNTKDVNITFGTTGNDAALTTGRVSQVFPNPAADMTSVQVSLTQGATISMELLNAVGQRVWASSARLDVGVHTLPVNVQDITAGVYLLRIQGAGAQAQTRRVIKQ